MDKKHNVTQANWANIWKAKTACILVYSLGNSNDKH